MTYLVHQTGDQLYQEVLSHLLEEGVEAAPKGKTTKELIGMHLVLGDPAASMITLPGRKLNYHFMVAEWVWMSLGMNDVDMIAPYNKQITQFSDDGATFRGAYGPKLLEQLPYVLEVLWADPASRQAVMTFWRERPRQSRDVPCTVSVQFLRRDEEDGFPISHVDMLVYMRSNDAWLGLPYDLFNFTQLQAQVAFELGAVMGTYHHIVGSMHLYEEHWEKARALLKAPVELHKRSLILPPVTAMPPAFRATFIGLTLMAKHPEETADSMLAWLNPVIQSLPTPWDLYLNLLGHRFHQRDEELMPVWRTLLSR